MHKPDKYVSFYLNDQRKRFQFKVSNLEAATKLAIKFKAPSFWYGEKYNDKKYNTQDEKRKNVNLW